MKIGILTLPFNNNYRGYLQAYALMTILKQMGYEVELIYRRNNRRSLKWRLKTIIIIEFLKSYPLIYKLFLGRTISHS